jgi:uncharacterized membrane protein HdeD (DUF308 family)
MSVLTDRELHEAEGQVTGLWWMFLIAGIAWTVIAFMVLAFKPGTPATIGYLAGFVLVLAGVDELIQAGVATSWRWLHVVLGAVFVVAGVMAILEPFQTFGILALLIGWYLLVNGMSDIVVSILERDVLPLWGLLLATGIVQVMIGVWAIGYPGRSAWLLVLWVGAAALVRGVTEIMFAVKLRSARHDIA